MLAPNYSVLGRDDEAQAAVQELLRLQPDSSLAAWAQPAYSGGDPDLAERSVDALRKAGLPE